MRRALLAVLVTLAVSLAAPVRGSAAAGAVSPAISEGSSGPEVLEMQRALRSLGYDAGPLDGVFGERTRVALEVFQESCGLTPDGIAGPATMAALSAAMEKAGAGPLAGRVIVIDPGHGGSNPGAIGTLGTREADHTLAIALETEAMLRRLGARVMMTRWGDRDSIPAPASRSDELSARAGMANSARADLFVSVHCNFYDKDQSVSGAMAFHNGSAVHRRLAAAVLGAVCDETGLEYLGLEQASFRVLVESRVPSVLVEIGFMSNPRDEGLLASQSFRRKAARGLLNGIVEFLDAEAD